MDFIYSKQAIKIINGLDKPTKQRIRNAIEQLPKGDIKLLQGRLSVYRLRVGGWRILFSYASIDTIQVEKIAPRGQAYKEG
jgi:mRNA interferase RelE/StbE